MTSRFRTSVLPGGLWAAAILLVVLLPGSWLAWQWRAMPHVSEYHDDGIYFVSAKSLAESGDYSIGSLPQKPAQTKYPPLWPALLSLVWRISPQFPANLPIAMLLCWIWLPLTLLAYLQWLRLASIPASWAILLAAVWALNPYVILFSTTMLSEMVFTFLLLAALLALHSTQPRWALIAGVLAGIAFLTRTAGIALLPAAAALCLFERSRGRFLRLGLFSAGMVPAVLAWGLWSARNRASGADEISLYYTNYLGHYLAAFEWSNLPLYAWKNIDGILHSLGSLLLPDLYQSQFDKVLAECLAIAGILGIRRLLSGERNRMRTAYAGFAVFFALLLAVWNFPPTERLVLPIAPLWLAGLLTEMKHLAANIAAVFGKPDRGQKFAGALVAVVLSSAFLYCGARQSQLISAGLPKFFQDHVERLQQSEPAMAWIRQNLPSGATFLCENDPLLFLRTGRRGAGLVFLPTIHWYRNDQDARTAGFASAARFATERNLGYFLLNDWDYSRDMPSGQHAKLIRTLKQEPRFELLFRDGPTSVYRLRPAQ